MRKEQAKVLATGLELQDAAFGGVSRLPAARWYGSVSRYMGDLFQVQVELSGVAITEDRYTVQVVDEVDEEVSQSGGLTRHSFRVQRVVSGSGVQLPRWNNVVIYIDPKHHVRSTQSVVGGECDCSTYMGWMMQCRHITVCMSSLQLFVHGRVDLALSLFHPRWQLSNVRLLCGRIWTELHEHGKHQLPPQNLPANPNVRVSDSMDLMLDRQNGAIQAMADSLVRVFGGLNMEDRTGMLRQVSGLLAAFAPLNILDMPVNESGEVSETEDQKKKVPVDQPEQRMGSGRTGVSTSGPGAGGSAVHNPVPRPREKKGRPEQARAVPGDEASMASRPREHQPRLKKTKRACSNCRVGGHLATNCPHPCGKCGMDDHKRHKCKAKRRRVVHPSDPADPDPPEGAHGHPTGIPSDDENIEEHEFAQGIADLFSDEEGKEEDQVDENEQEHVGGGGRPLSRRGGRGFSS